MQTKAKLLPWRLPVFTTAMLGLLSVVGCGQSGPKTHPVKGKVELANGDIKVLTGSFVEAAQVTDLTVRSSGIIQPDGTFTLETLYEGSCRNGALPGQYHVRIVIAEDDRQLQQQAVRAIAPRFLDLKTSGLVIDVPTATPITLDVTAR